LPLSINAIGYAYPLMANEPKVSNRLNMMARIIAKSFLLGSLPASVTLHCNLNFGRN